MNSTSTTLQILARVYTNAEYAFKNIPGSAVIQRYVKSSHQNDPGRTILELILLIFAIRTLFQSKTRADKHFIRFSDKEIDELVDEWTPEPLVQPLTAQQERDLASTPIILGPNGPKPKLMSTGKTVVNLASFDFAGLSGNEEVKDRAVEALRRYGLGSCGPPGFYGTLDVHIQLEHDIADFLGTEAAILYSQGFSTVSSVIPAFCKRGDIIVADRGVNFAIQKGIQISRSTVRWFDHNDLKSLEDVLESVEKERKKRRGPLTRRFIVTEGIFEKDGAMVDLPKLIDIKFKHKYRLVLDESISFGTVGRTGRGLTELYNASKVDMLIGSVANGLYSCGGFCAGSQIVVKHQRINGLSFVFSASMPALLSVAASAGINILCNTPSILATLQENVQAARAILDRLECITIPSHPASPIIHIYIKNKPLPKTTDTGNKDKDSQQDDDEEEEEEEEERLLQDVVDEVLVQGVMITKAKRLAGQEVVKSRPSIRLAMTSGLTRKETEKAVGVIRIVLIKILGGRKRC